MEVTAGSRDSNELAEHAFRLRNRVKDVTAEREIEAAVSDIERVNACMFETQTWRELGIATSRKLQVLVQDVDPEYAGAREEFRDPRGDFAGTAAGIENRRLVGQRVTTKERRLLRPNRTRLRLEIANHRLVGHLLRLRIEIHAGCSGARRDRREIELA